MKRKKILILDEQTTQILPIAKSLHEKGHFVIGFFPQKMSYGYYSKFVNERVLSPSLLKNEEVYLEFLLDYLSKNNIDVLVPLNDASAHFLSKYKAKLTVLTKFVMPDEQVFLKAYDKGELMKLCEKLEIDHPKTLHPQEDNTFNIEGFSFPALLKPNLSSGGRGIKLIKNKEELISYSKSHIKSYGKVHLQQFIQNGGKQIKVQLFLDKNHDLINYTILEKIRFYPVNGGSSCFSKSIEMPKIVDRCYEILKEIDWVGFADFDLIQDPLDLKYKIMEINPRVPACIKASFVSGVDFAQNIIEASLDVSVTRFVYKKGSKLKHFNLDVLWFIKSNNRWKYFKSWINIFGKNIYFQDGYLIDPLPFFTGTISGLMKQLNPEFRKQKESGL